MIENEWPRKERVVNRQQDEKQNSIERQVNLSIPRFSQQLDLTETLKVSFFFSFYEGQRKQKKNAKCEYYSSTLFSPCSRLFVTFL